jgi:hypothetical protein
MVLAGEVTSLPSTSKHVTLPFTITVWDLRDFLTNTTLHDLPSITQPIFSRETECL